MGVVKYPNISNYWSKAERYTNNVAPNVMSRNKFELILRFLHYSDNETSDKSDRLYKVRNMINPSVGACMFVTRLNAYKRGVHFSIITI